MPDNNLTTSVTIEDLSSLTSSQMSAEDSFVVYDKSEEQTANEPTKKVNLNQLNKYIRENNDNKVLLSASLAAGSSNIFVDNGHEGMLPNPINDFYQDNLDGTYSKKADTDSLHVLTQSATSSQPHFQSLNSSIFDATISQRGLVPILSGNTNTFLNGQGRWSVPANTTYDLASTVSEGLVPTLSASTAEYSKILRAVNDNSLIWDNSIDIDRINSLKSIGGTYQSSQFTFVPFASAAFLAERYPNDGIQLS